jgi:hypothetical protein
MELWKRRRKEEGKEREPSSPNSLSSPRAPFPSSLLHGPRQPTSFPSRASVQLPLSPAPPFSFFPGPQRLPRPSTRPARSPLLPRPSALLSFLSLPCRPRTSASPSLSLSSPPPLFLPAGRPPVTSRGPAPPRSWALSPRAAHWSRPHLGSSRSAPAHGLGRCRNDPGEAAARLLG